MPRPTIADVAKAAGVSNTTVSHALTGQGRINEETRQRIQAAADRLGYSPNMMARGLRTARTRLLAIANAVPAEIADGAGDLSMYMAVASAAARAALRSGYATILIPPDAEPGIFSGIAIDGAVVMDPQTSDPFLAALRRHNVPFVTIGREPGATEPEWCVDSDMVQATTLLLDHFAAGGPSRPALILSVEERSYSTDALAAYTRWTAAHGLPPVVVTVPEKQAEAGGEKAMARLLAEHPDVNAVFIPLDPFATGAYRALAAAGLRIPQDMQLATLDGTRARLGVPPATALADDYDAFGRSAVALLLDRLQNPASPARNVTLAPRLMIRTSTLADGSGTG
ncbi:MAG: LacI family transcriptional regulator [Tabrizicola sp.]|jgi:DNA-binding LacI/PurR family transcriptional regulator|nr:LacI family transcriptional regulator [Tabrizicola sp.]